MNNKIKATAMDSVTELSPKIKRSRSTFNLGIRDYTSFNVGELVPLGGFTEVLPGDTFNVDLATFIRLTSPSRRPTMDNLHMDIYAFYVPFRFLDESWVQVQGESKQAWVAPAASCSTYEMAYGENIAAGSLFNHLGLPIGGLGLTSGNTFEFNIYPIYAYMKIFNDWFRDENIQDEIPFDNTNNVYGKASVPKINNKYLYEKGSLLKVAKYHDVFTSALPAPQKAASAVSIPIGTMAPIVGATSLHDTTNVIKFSGTNGVAAGVVDLYLSSSTSGGPGNLKYAQNTTTAGTLYDVNKTNLVADLSNASAATINQLRLAFQLQKAYELDARSGTRYTESIEARFGVKNPDLRLGRSELLGHYRFDLNMSEVNSTTDYGASVGNDLKIVKGDFYTNGVGAGQSKTGNQQHICVKSFTEHGLFMILGCVRTDLTYQQGVEKFWTKKERWSFYEPIFSNIGEVPIMKSELYGAVAANDSVFGYQEAWYEYRYKQNHISSVLASDANQGLDIFHYGVDFNAAPTLSEAFIQQSTAGLDRTLLLGSSVVDNFICQVEGVIKATRVMPLFSTPGLIDHF